MEIRILSSLVFSAAIASGLCTPMAGQPPPQQIPANQYKITPVSEKMPPMPFPPMSGKPTIEAIQFRTPGQMTARDRDVEADGEASIRERVNFSGLEFNEHNWSYQQIVCPALPNHVLLRFTRNNGKGDESVFTASIPRMGDGRVRIIPILRRGYSLFSPAPVNALTILAFNHIRDEEHPDGPPDWLTTGMCYAALAGAHPQVALGPVDPKAPRFPSGTRAALEILPQGGANIRFLDVAAAPKPMEWTMTFNGKGKLLKAAHVPAPWNVPVALPPTAAQAKGTPIPPTIMEVTGKPTP